AGEGSAPETAVRRGGEGSGGARPAEDRGARDAAGRRGRGGDGDRRPERGAYSARERHPGGEGAAGGEAAALGVGGAGRARGRGGGALAIPLTAASGSHGFTGLLAGSGVSSQVVTAVAASRAAAPKARSAARAVPSISVRRWV